MANKAKRKVSIFEIVYYSIGGCFLLWGLTYLLLGFIAEFLPSDAPLYSASKNLELIKWGTIIASISAVAIVVVLLVYAKKSDLVFEKEQKRAQRLAAIHANAGVVDAEVAPAEPKAE